MARFTGQGILNDVLASGEDKLLTAWARDLAIGEVCGAAHLFDEAAAAVPEPATVMLLVAMGLATARRWRR